MVNPENLDKTEGVKKFINWFAMQPANGKQNYLKFWLLVAEYYKDGGWVRVQEKHP
jgi:hypothetical protein